MASEKVKPTWLIKRNGSLNTNVDKDLKLSSEDSPIISVSIIGAQSSGKTTLLNHLFGTNFDVMDASLGRFRTTRGLWIAKKPIAKGRVLVIDTEGSDGAEQENDLTFEKQTALFALAVSDTIIINMWCNDVGRNQASRWPCLTVILEALMRICDTRRRTLLFVLRDRTKSPPEKLERQIMDKLYQVWRELRKPQDKRDAALQNYFNIEVVTMSNYEYKEETFKLEAADLKDKIISYSTSVASTNKGIAASGFAQYATRIWDLIQEDKDINLPRERILVAEVRCNQIANENYKKFCENESWRKIKKDLYSMTTTKGFGQTVNLLVETSLSGYDKEALYFDEAVREKRREQLLKELLQVVEPIYALLMERICHATLQSFKKSIDLEQEAIKKDKDLLEVIQNYILDFIAKLKAEFADACIEHANWNYSTKLREIKVDEATAYLELEKKRLQDKLKDKIQRSKSIWSKWAWFVVDMIFKATSITVSFIFPNHPFSWAISFACAVAPRILRWLVRLLKKLWKKVKSWWSS